MDRISARELDIKIPALKNTAFRSLNESRGFALFRQTGSCVIFEKTPQIEPEDVTISLWIKSLSWSDPTATALAVKRALSDTGYFLFVLTVPQTIHFDWGGVSSRWNTGYQPPLYRWVHLCLTRQGSGRKLFVNGYQKAVTSDAGNSSAVPSDVSLLLGKNGLSGGYQFKGEMFGFSFWNRALSADEVRRAYHGALIINGLNVSCPFKDNARDLSGNNNHGIAELVTFKRK